MKGSKPILIIVDDPPRPINRELLRAELERYRDAYRAELQYYGPLRVDPDRLGPDAAHVSFVHEDAEREMQEWDAILKGHPTT